MRHASSTSKTHQPKRIGPADLRLSQAIQAGDAGRAQAAIESGADVNRQDPMGTPLMTAALSGCLPLIDLLLARGADPNGQIANGLSPALTASAGGHDDALEALCKAGANLHHKLEDGMGAMLCACRSGNPKAVAFLLSKGVEMREFSKGSGLTPMTLCAKLGHHECLRLLLGAGCDPMTLLEPREPVESIGSHSCLSLAAMQGHEECVRILAQHPKTDPLWRNENGETALGLAKANRHSGCEKFIQARILSIQERKALDKIAKPARAGARKSRI